MKKLYFVLVLVFSLNSTLFSQVSPFLPDVFGNYPVVRDIAIGNDEIYFSLKSVSDEIAAITLLKKTKHGWGDPEIASFSGQFLDIEPFLSPDGKELYFASNRPIHKDSTARRDYNIWYVKRKSKDSDWSAAILLPYPINTKHNEFYPAITNSGNVYITSDRPESLGKDDLYVAIWNGEDFTQIKNLGSSINSAGYEFNAYVSPDEELLLYTAYNRADGFGSGDLYQSTKDENGTWSLATNLGDAINSSAMDYCPFYKDGILYFTSKRSSIIQGESKRRTYQEIEKLINQYENGMSRIYHAPFSPSAK